MRKVDDLPVLKLKTISVAHKRINLTVKGRKDYTVEKIGRLLFCSFQIIKNNRTLDVVS